MNQTRKQPFEFTDLGKIIDNENYYHMRRSWHIVDSLPSRCVRIALVAILTGHSILQSLLIAQSYKPKNGGL